MCELLTVKQVEALTQIPVSWWYEKARLGLIPPRVTFKIGKYRRFRRDALLEWLAKQGVGDSEECCG